MKNEYIGLCTVQSVTTKHVELLNLFEESGIPPLILKLKVGVPIMILRNMDEQHGKNLKDLRSFKFL